MTVVDLPKEIGHVLYPPRARDNIADHYNDHGVQSQGGTTELCTTRGEEGRKMGKRCE